MVRICLLNIEGISGAKYQSLHKILSQSGINVVTIQEIHTKKDEYLRGRGNITGYNPIGTATYVVGDVENATLISTSTLH